MKPLRPTFSTSDGFTLIELLVVVSIISLLSSIVLASLSTARQKAMGVKVVSEAHSIVMAIELYRSDHDGALPAAGTWKTDIAPYINSIPTSATWYYDTTGYFSCGDLTVSPYVVYYTYTTSQLLTRWLYAPGSGSTNRFGSNSYCDAVK